VVNNIVSKKIISHAIVSISTCTLARILSIFFLHFKLKSIVSGKSIIFVLDIKRFREDVSILRKTTNIYYVNFPTWLQDKIIGVLDFSNVEQKEGWLSKFINCLCRATDSIGFISAGMHYERHAIWERSTTDAKKSFFCLHREGIGADSNIIKRDFIKKLSIRRKFNGSMLMVGTETLRDSLIEKNLISKDKVIVTGLPRFDKIYHYMNSKYCNFREKNTILLFSFFVSFFSSRQEATGLYPTNGGFRKLFDGVHSAVAQFALDHPESSVIIKLKWYQGKSKENVDSAIIKGTGVSPNKIKNLRIIDDIPAQELIMQSRVVVGFNSTTIIESILYGKKVIVPEFAEAAQKENANNVFFKNELNSFYRANSRSKLTSLMEEHSFGKDDSLKINESFVYETIGPYDGKICTRIEDVITGRQSQAL
jgi:hypothetical protein